MKKNNLKWNKTPKLKSQMLNLLEDSIERQLQDIGIGIDILKITPWHRKPHKGLSQRSR